MEVLGTIAGNVESQNAIAQEGAISPLVDLLRDGTGPQKSLSAYALGQISSDNDTTSYLSLKMELSRTW